MELKIAICDDDTEVLNENKKIIASIFDERNKEYTLDIFDSSQELWKSAAAYDMVFLDIETDEYDGITLARKILQVNKDCFVFFITNYQIYLDKAFDINTFRFLPKPIDAARLASGIDVALDRIRDRELFIGVTDFQNKITVNIEISSIIYIENEGRRTHIVTTEYDFTAKELFSKLKEQIEKEVNYFASPHQSYLVNLKYVTAYTRQKVTLSYAGMDYTAEMSRRKYNDFGVKFFSMAKLLK
ncbi:MAG: LytTR family DNA-binding domain-containing protein [Firmicutes bacterium]|nr:LytTR family DNA-binding domain-containing protein [Bacillota bacterium]